MASALTLFLKCLKISGLNMANPLVFSRWVSASMVIPPTSDLTRAPSLLSSTTLCSTQSAMSSAPASLCTASEIATTKKPVISKTLTLSASLLTIMTMPASSVVIRTTRQVWNRLRYSLWPLVVSPSHTTELSNTTLEAMIPRTVSLFGRSLTRLRVTSTRLLRRSMPRERPARFGITNTLSATLPTISLPTLAVNSLSPWLTQETLTSKKYPTILSLKVRPSATSSTPPLTARRLPLTVSMSTSQMASLRSTFPRLPSPKKCSTLPLMLDSLSLSSEKVVMHLILRHIEQFYQFNPKTILVLNSFSILTTLIY